MKALPVWLAFAGGRFGYAEHLNFLLFTCGHVFLWRAALVGIGVLVCHWRWARWWVVPRTVAALLGLSLASGYLVKWLARWLTT